MHVGQRLEVVARREQDLQPRGGFLVTLEIVAGTITFAVFLLLWVINWVGPLTGPRMSPVLDYLSITSHLDDFTRGVVDTKHLVYYVSFIVFGLFLTARSVDTERWRG